jgi:hypothetical protein
MSIPLQEDFEMALMTAYLFTKFLTLCLQKNDGSGRTSSNDHKKTQHPIPWEALSYVTGEVSEDH